MKMWLFWEKKAFDCHLKDTEPPHSSLGTRLLITAPSPFVQIRFIT